MTTPLHTPVRERLKVLLLAVLVGALCGAASALFLWLLEEATDFRVAHRAWVYALPLAGLVIGFGYDRFGKSVQAGNNLVLDRVVDGGPQVPTRMAPLVMVGTVLTHLFGGSAGREGTAVQMGASLADWLSHRLRVAPEARQVLLMAGMAGGFGSVFGTPWAGALFAIEVAMIGRLQVRATLPALVASFVGDFVTRALGVGHAVYPPLPSTKLDLTLAGKWVLFSIALALATITFIELTHVIKTHGARLLPRLPLRMFVGGALVVVMWTVSGSDDYLGLGVPTILRAFSDPTLAAEAFALKLLFTAVTIGFGFIGGEVTPLFFVGATLGGLLARTLDVPLALGATVGLAAVFGSAANAPLALSVMAAELVGIHALPHVLLVSALTFLLTGHRGIYSAQRVARSKFGRPLSVPVALRDWSQRRHSKPSPTNGPA